MSKIKHAHLDEAALDTSIKILKEIDKYIDSMDFSNTESVKNLSKLVSTFTSLKPYF